MNCSFLQRLRGRLGYFFSLPGFQKHPLLTIWRTFSWWLKCTFGIPGVVRVAAWNNASVILPPEWKGAGATLFYAVREYYEPELTFLGRFLNPGEIFVDAGANCGVYTMAAASIVGPKGLVLGFEPGQQLFGYLTRSVERNGFKQVKLFETGLSNITGTAQLYAHPHGASSFSLGQQEGVCGKSFTIPLQKLDDLLDAQGIETVDCIKMDVEGAEELILQGAIRLFQKCKPRVIFEINPRAIAALSLERDGAWAFLKDRGYDFFALDLEGGLTALPAAPEEGGNFIALPRTSGTEETISAQ